MQLEPCPIEADPFERSGLEFSESIQVISDANKDIGAIIDKRWTPSGKPSWLVKYKRYPMQYKEWIYYADQ
jgi:hypothetical protein